MIERPTASLFGAIPRSSTAMAQQASSRRFDLLPPGSRLNSAAPITTVDAISIATASDVHEGDCVDRWPAAA